MKKDIYLLISIYLVIQDKQRVRRKDGDQYLIPITQHLTDRFVITSEIGKPNDSRPINRVVHFLASLQTIKSIIVYSTDERNRWLKRNIIPSPLSMFICAWECRLTAQLIRAIGGQLLKLDVDLNAICEQEKMMQSNSSSILWACIKAALFFSVMCYEKSLKAEMNYCKSERTQMSHQQMPQCISPLE